MNGFKVGGGICISPLPVLRIRVWIFVIKCGNKSDKDPGNEKEHNIKMKNQLILWSNIQHFLFLGNIFAYNYYKYIESPL